MPQQKPLVLVFGPKQSWAQLAPALAGAGYRPVHSPSGEVGDGGAQCGIVIEDDHSPALPAAEVRSRAGYKNLPLLLIPGSTSAVKAFTRLGYDDLTSASPENVEVRSRVARLLEFAEVAAAQARVQVLETQVAKLEAQVQQLREQGTGHDALTGLADAQAFRAFLSHLADGGGPVSCALFNVDQMSVHNTRGQSFGDRVLVQVARCMEASVPVGGMVARVGGDVFGWGSSLDPVSATTAANEVRRAILPLPEQVHSPLTVSVGVSTGSSPADPDHLWRHAEDALFEAKAQGRNRVVHADHLNNAAGPTGDSGEKALEAHARVLSERFGRSLAQRGRRMLDQAQQAATTDPLTGLFNRRYLDEQLPREQESARLQSVPLTVALLDVDHFGRVNKEHGWVTGDRVLKGVALRIRETVRGSDWVARYGGEEVVVVMPAAGLPEAYAVAERVRSAIAAQPFETVEGVPLEVTASIGLAEADPNTPFEQVFHQASKTLLVAKEGGRNQVRPHIGAGDQNCNQVDGTAGSHTAPWV